MRERGEKQGAKRDGGFPPCPLFIDLVGASVLVVGGGRVALRKAQMLLGYGARVRVVSPSAREELRVLAEEGHLSWEKRAWREGDCVGARLVVAATDDARANARAAAEARACGALVDSAQAQAGGDATVPATVRRGDFQVAVSTNGAAPGLAREVRERLEGEFPPYYEGYVRLLGELRDLVKARVPGSAAERRPVFEAILGDGKLLQDAENGTLESPAEAYERIVGSSVAPSAQRCAEESGGKQA